MDLARKYNMQSVNVDLIYGLPGQTAADWRRDLEAAVAGAEPLAENGYKPILIPLQP